MNRFQFMIALVLCCGASTGCIEVNPNTTGGPGGIVSNNVNTTNANSQIRLWILNEEQIKTPPTTKREAERLESFVQPRFRTFTFNRNPGTYYVVASNQTHYQSIRDNASFSPGVDFSLLEVVVEEKFVPVSVRNGAGAARLPVITSP